jgi:DNA-binding NtrC family response regulator
MLVNHALIVEDDADAARMVAALVASQGYSAATALSLQDARRQLALQAPDLLLLDLRLPDGNGLSLLEDTELLGQPEVVLMTGHASLESSIQALRLGAVDYLVKPLSAGMLQGMLARVRGPGQRGAPDPAPRPAPGTDLERTGRFGHLVGRSAPMRQVYEQIARVAGTSVTVFITGESGTGKELVAQTVHDMSRRRDKPFLAVNCGAISPHLIESEIFGHERGSFTGAERQRQGFFERAHGGTLFLDEITEMSPALQVKLLRVLESGTFMRVGSSVAQESDVRIIAAANRDLACAVAQGQLREDLMYRLHVFPIEIPPLRARPDDIPLLVAHFLQEIGQREGQPRRATPAALERLARHPWPGNVRELRNALQRAWVMSTGSEITEAWLPQVSRHEAPPVSAPSREGGLPVAMGTPLAMVERQVILATLAHCGQHKERAAALLGVSLKTLYNRLKAYGVQG